MNSGWQPVIVDRAAMSSSEWNAFLADHPVWRTTDTLHSQLVELVRTRNPAKEDLPLEACESHIETLLDGVPIECFGRWVYYPWSGDLVHVLGPDAFDELRSDRNRFKITPEERAHLRQLCIGVVGLSVGNIIAFTLAQEGLAGHLKLADFDELELSNLNRIRAGVCDIGVNKAVLAARQIVAIDPYASLTVETAGLTEDTLDPFLSDPRLDVLVDECDGIRMKFRMRERARELRIPVLMETSDRGMLDVERFDLDPSRPLFHGLVGDITTAQLDRIDSERKAVLMMAIIGSQTVSPRAAASLMEIDRSISAWPQLASDVTLGGATLPTAIRMLALRGDLESGRRFLDLEHHLRHPAPAPPLPDSEPPRPLPAPGLAEHAHDLDDIPDHVQRLVEKATKAPSGGNCQPWAFRWDGESLWVLHDAERSRNHLDGRRHASLLAIGGALENLELAATATSQAVRIHRFPMDDRPDVVARVTLGAGTPPTLPLRRLAEAIDIRMTNRRFGRERPLAGLELLGLLDAARTHRASLDVCVNPSGRAQLGRLLGRSDRIRMLCGPLHAELMGEVRFGSGPHAEGIGLDQLEMTEFQKTATQVIARPDVAASARRPGRGRALEEGSRDAMAHCSAAALLSIDGSTPTDWLSAGAAVQRVWLTASTLGLAMHPMTAVLYMFELAEDQPDLFTDAEREELAGIRRDLYRVFPSTQGRTPVFLFRLAHAPEATARSGRLPLDRVLGLGSPIDL